MATALTTATCTGGWVEYPFNHLGDSTTKVYHHSMAVKATSYAPLDFDDVMTAAGDKPTGSPFADDSAAYWVGDFGMTSIDGGMVRFERVFANVPQSRTDSNILSSVTFPGVDSTVTNVFSVTSTSAPSISNIAASYGDGFFENTLYITFTLTASLSSGDVATLSVGQSAGIKNDCETSGKFYVLYDGSYHSVQSASGVITDITGTTVTFSCTAAPMWNPGGSYLLYTIQTDDPDTAGDQTTTATFSATLYARSQYSKSKKCTVSVRYQKASDVENLVLEKEFLVVAGSGRTEPVATLTSTTIPTKTEYGQNFASGLIPFVVRDETASRWMGNIWQIESVTTNGE